jgi:hypothetical protein
LDTAQTCGMARVAGAVAAAAESYYFFFLAMAIFFFRGRLPTK